MRILLLTETIPFPLDSGGRIKTYHTLRNLSAEHEVHCHAFIRDADERRHAGELERHCASLTLHLLTPGMRREVRALGRSLVAGVPFTVARHFRRGVLARLRDDCRSIRFDVGYYDHLSMFEYARHLGLPIIHDAHNVESELLRRYAATLGARPARLLAEREWRLVRAYERRAYAACHLVFAVSERDASGIRTLAATPVDVRTLPIAIDASGIVPVMPLTTAPSLLFVGGLHWPPNADAIRHFVTAIWPLVRRERPDAELTVVGRDDAPVARRLRGVPGVRLLGRVEDVGSCFDRTRAFVVPLRSGGGMRVKILEALARGVPVVSTTVGAEGIAAVPGVHLLVADDPGEFARETARLFADDPLARSLAAAGRRLVLDRYDAQVIGRDLRRIISDVGLALQARKRGGLSDKSPQ